MKQITQEWMDKAEGDFATAQRELQVQQMPNYDAVCFDSQNERLRQRICAIDGGLECSVGINSDHDS